MAINPSYQQYTLDLDIIDPDDKNYIQACELLLIKRKTLELEGPNGYPVIRHTGSRNSLTAFCITQYGEDTAFAEENIKIT